MQEGYRLKRHPCARYGFNSYRLPHDLNSSKVILRDRVVWNYLISETTCFQGRSLLSCAETPSVKHTPSRHVCRYGEGNSEGGFTPQRYEKFFNWQWILGNGQWKFDNRQLFFAKLCLNRWDATICMGARSYIYRNLHIDAWYMQDISIMMTMTNDKWQLTFSGKCLNSRWATL